jgi:hypothetical protein
VTELQWIEKNTEFKRVYMFRNWYGDHYEADVPRDESDVAEMYRDVTTTSGIVLGSHPEIGDVYLSSGEPPKTKTWETGGSGPWIRIDTPTSNP